MSNESDRQRATAEDEVVRPLVDRMIDIGAIDPPEDGEYEVVWD